MTRLFAFLLAAPLTGCDEKETADADGDGYVNDDCDDNDANVNPDAAEICDGLDNNCDGQTDESTAIDAGVW